MIDTTVNIRPDLLGALEDASRRAGVARREMISSLLNMVSRRERRSFRCWVRVRYQKMEGERPWRRIHMRFRDDEYEFALDLRKVRKMSVSFLLSYAIEKYLSEIHGESGEYTDNYRYRNYAILNIFIEDVSCWIFCWGIPPKIPRYRL
ncbi:MAG TPA: hypothetical protein PKY31_05335 [Spirochaetota bacterium]|nr:hypothetical protein [Spirochaetota bacterium]